MGNQATTLTQQEKIQKVKQVLSPKRKTPRNTPASAASARRRLFEEPLSQPAFKPWLEYNCESQIYKFSDFLISDVCLGEGSFAAVKIATHIPTKEIVAVKIITKAKIPSEMRVYAINESRFLRLMDSKNIIGHYLTHEDAENIYVFLEYNKGGDLYSLVEKRGRLSEDLSKRIMKQVVSALSYCHQNNVCHRDIKLENILYSGDDKDIKVKLIDFGFASIIPSEEYLFKDFPGSMLYAAPELLEGTPYNARISDVYSMGVLFYIMLYGRYPFFSESNVELLEMIQTSRAEFDHSISPIACDLVSRMLTCDPSKRITVDEIMMHPWFATRKDEMMSPIKEKIKNAHIAVVKQSQNLRYSLSPKSSRRKAN